jgi:hypothetical protein
LTVLEKVILFHIVTFFMKTCNDCRSTGGRIAKAYALPRNVPPPSPPGIPKKKCGKCKREWSLSRFIDNAGEQCPECEFCRGSNQSLLFSILFLIYKPSINNLSDLKLLSRASQIPFFIHLHLAPPTLVDLHLPHVVHFPDSG